MAIDESTRRRLQRGLTGLLGQADAVTLIEELPRADPATKEDLDAVERRLGGRIDGVEHRMDGLEHRMDGLEHKVDGVGARVETLGGHVIRLEERLESVKFEVLGALHKGLHEGLGSVRNDILTQSRMLFFAMVGTMATFAAVIVAVIRLP